MAHNSSNASQLRLGLLNVYPEVFGLRGHGRCSFPGACENYWSSHRADIANIYQIPPEGLYFEPILREGRLARDLFPR